jgi:hypothetical protein
VTYWQTVAGFACLAAGGTLWAFAVGAILADGTDDDIAWDLALFLFLLALGCLAFAGAVKLL